MERRVANEPCEANSGTHCRFHIQQLRDTLEQTAQLRRRHVPQPRRQLFARVSPLLACVYIFPPQLAVIPASNIDSSVQCNQETQEQGISGCCHIDASDDTAMDNKSYYIHKP